MLISIITVTYNAENMVEDTIKSVIVQKNADVEFIIIDGKSNDRTIEIINKYSKYITRIVSERDGGIYDAMNKGVRIANGEYVLFLNAGDILRPRTIEKIGKFFHNNYAIVYGNVQMGAMVYGGEFNNFKIAIKNICQQSVFYKKDLFTKYGGFDTKYLIAADHLFNIICFGNEGGKIKYVNEIICDFDVSGVSTRFNDELFLANQTRIVKENLGWRCYLFCLCVKLIVKIKRDIMCKFESKLG